MSRRKTVSDVMPKRMKSRATGPVELEGNLAGLYSLVLAVLMPVFWERGDKVLTALCITLFLMCAGYIIKLTIDK